MTFQLKTIYLLPYIGGAPMRKSIIFIMLLMVGAFISGCSGEKSESKGLSLPDENGEEVSFENMEEPALVFFFTGVG